MRFTTAWAKVAAQNITLKVSILSISFCLIFMSFVCVKLALKEPVLIERSCFSEAIEAASSKHNEKEIKAFIKEALIQRFDSKSDNHNLLSEKEIGLRVDEQKQLSSRDMHQRILINDVLVKKDGIYIDADRLISVDKVRSAFIFPLIAHVSSTTRTRKNPYGLILNKVDEFSEDDENAKAKK